MKCVFLNGLTHIFTKVAEKLKDLINQLFKARKAALADLYGKGQGQKGEARGPCGDGVFNWVPRVSDEFEVVLYACKVLKDTVINVSRSHVLLVCSAAQKQTRLFLEWLLKVLNSKSNRNETSRTTIKPDKIQQFWNSGRNILVLSTSSTPVTRRKLEKMFYKHIDNENEFVKVIKGSDESQLVSAIAVNALGLIGRISDNVKCKPVVITEENFKIPETKLEYRESVLVLQDDMSWTHRNQLWKDQVLNRNGKELVFKEGLELEKAPIGSAADYLIEPEHFREHDLPAESGVITSVWTIKQNKEFLREKELELYRINDSPLPDIPNLSSSPERPGSSSTESSSPPSTSNRSAEGSESTE